MIAESTTEIEPSIYDLYKKVYEHPEFAGGTIWTRYDVADALFVPEDETPTPEQVASVTDEMRWDSEEVIRGFIFDTTIMEWRELLRAFMDIPEAMRGAYVAARPPDHESTWSSPRKESTAAADGSPQIGSHGTT